MQWVSWGAAGLSVCVFVAICRLLLPGAKQRSYWIWAMVLLSAPVFWRCALAPLPDMLALALVLGSIQQWLAYEYHRRPWQWAAALMLGLGAALAYPAAAALVAPMVLWGVYWAVRFRHDGLLWWGSGLGVVASILLVGINTPFFPAGLEPPTALGWSPQHWFARDFDTPNGWVHYTLPNLMHVFSPLCHWGFVPLLPLVLLLFKRIDLRLAERKMIVAALVAYGLLIAGWPVQQIQNLLPVWALLLLLLFPAFDRVFSYGLYFLPALMKKLGWVVLFIQLALIAYLNF